MLLFPQTQFAELQVPLTFHWFRGRNMSIGMSSYPQAVVLKGIVYVGGGSAASMDGNTIVMCYHIEHSQWSAIRYQTMYFAMTSIEEELVVVGGRHPMNSKTTRVIGALNASTLGWKYCSESLPSIGRDSSTAVVYNSRWLIVAGGRDDEYQSLSRVDILNLQNSEWYPGASLPQPAHKMTAAVIGNTLVLLGGVGGDGNKFLSKVFSVKLDDLVLVAPASPWQTLPDTPVVSATVLAFNGALLAIGGNRHDQWQWSARRIHLFKPSTKTWIEAGQLQIDRWRCACTVLPSGEIFIAGGATSPAGQAQREVHIGTHVVY